MALNQQIQLEPKGLELGEHWRTGVDGEHAIGHPLPRALIDL